MKIDMHIHTKYSVCSLMDPEKIVKIALKRGLDGIAITDHNTTKGYEFFRSYKDVNLVVIMGEEIKTDRGEILGLFLQEEVRPGIFEEAVDSIKDQDALIVLPHPFDRFRRFKGKIPVDEIHAVEILNSRTMFNSDNLKALKFSENNKISFTAGSDAHFYWEIGNAYVVADVDDSEELRKAILRREIKVFGRKGSVLNHAATKVVKAWRKIKF